MGLMDVFSSVSDSVTEKVRRHSPGVAMYITSGPNGCCRAWSSYDVGRAAVFKIDNFVRVKGSEKLKEYIPGPETQEKIGVLVDSPVGKEALKVIPGAVLAHETYKWWQSVKKG